jgi:serine protease Do
MNFQNIQKNPLYFLGGIAVFGKILTALLLLNIASAQASSTPDSFADLAEDLLPTVVNISSTQKIEERPSPYQRQPYPGQPPFQFPEGHPFNDFFEDFFGQQGPMMQMPRQPRRMLPPTSLGSGFILDKEEGLIITNNHVIDGADEIKITLHNDKVLPAEIIGTDSKTDIAVLKADLKGEDVNEARFGDSDVMRVGDWVIAIGNPFGLGGTVTAGIISARQRDIQSGPYDDYIQTDASINRGNSGGPMFNIKGEVIGINTAIFSPTGGSVGIGFAIPSAMAEPVIKQLNEYGRTRRGWLGVKIQEVTDEIAESLGLAKAAGALVAEVTSTGPAEKSGIKAGDIILAFDNKPIREMRNLPRIVAETDIDKDVPIIVWRDGKRVNLTANVGELEKAEEEGLLAMHDGGAMMSDSEPTAQGTAFETLGLTLMPLNDTKRQTYGIEQSVAGLVVTDADLNRDAAQKGVSEGDVITAINQKTASLDVLRQEIEKAQQLNRESILFLLNRNGNIQFVAVKIQDETEEATE